MRDDRSADWTLLALIVILFLIVVVGFLTLRPQASPVVGAAEMNPCAACTGTPVCGSKDGVLSNYESACAAACAGAAVVFPDVCEQIPE